MTFDKVSVTFIETKDLGIIMSNKDLKEECGKLRDDLVKSLSNSKMKLDPKVIDDFVDFTNNYIREAYQINVSEEKKYGQVVSDEELSVALLRKFKERIADVKEIAISGVFHELDGNGNVLESHVVGRDSMKRILQSTKQTLTKYQEFLFNSKEKEAKSSGVLRKCYHEIISKEPDFDKEVVGADWCKKLEEAKKPGKLMIGDAHWH